MTTPRSERDARARVTPPPPHEISSLLLSFEELRARRGTLLADLRTLMQEIQLKSARLRGERSGGPTNGTGSLAARLQLEYGMTPREIEVALLLAEGLSNAAVARHLDISPHTARHHTQRVLGKLGVHSRSEAGARLRR